MEGQSIAERIRDALDRFTRTERKAAHVLLANYPVAGLETTAEFAKRADVSAPTILRFVARLGFASYPDFQRALREELDKQGLSPLSKTAFGAGADGEGGPLAAFFGAVSDNLGETFRHAPAAEFEAMVALLADRRRRVHLIGGRVTDALAVHLAAHLRVVRPGVAPIIGQPGNWRDQAIDLGRQDVVVVFDIRRYQADLERFSAIASERGATVLLLTDQWLSPIARHARHVLAARVAVPSRWDSLTGLLALSEALLAAVTERIWPDAEARIAAIDALRKI